MSGVEKRRSDFSLPVAIGQVFHLAASVRFDMVCLLFPLIEPDRRISRIRLSEKTHTESN